MGGSGKLRKDGAALIFYSLNLVILLVGLDLWLTHSIARIVILYSIFSMILFYVTANAEVFDNSVRRIASPKALQLLAVIFVVLIAACFAGIHQALYVRPTYVVAALGVTIVVFVLMVLASYGQPMLKESFALLAAISIILLASFGSYLAQPNLTISPPYSNVDAYRDYVNAVRILDLSRIDPGMMILTQYYRGFPVLPLMIANISLVSGLPVNISHLVLAILADAIAVTSLFLLSKRVAGNHARGYSCLLLLPVLLVYLQPILVDPAWLVLPLRVTIPLVTMVLYLVYTRVLDSAPTRSTFLTLILLVVIIVPLNGVSAIAVILFLIITIMAISRRRRGGSSVAVLVILATVLLFFYLSGPGAAEVAETSQILWSLVAAGPGFLTQSVSQAQLVSRVHGSLSEIDLFLENIVPAFILSVLTIFVVKLALRGRSVVAGATQRFSYTILGVVAIVGFGTSVMIGVFPPVQIDPRYFTFPLTAVAVMATTMVFLWMLGDMSARRKLLVAGLLSLCILSTMTYPLYFENTPGYTRMMPIESERTAAMFVSTTFDARATDVTQVVTDWPYYNEVLGLLYSSHVGLESSVLVPNLMYGPIAICHQQETLMLSRRYFMQSTYLQTISPYVKPLSDNSTWSHFNRIYDDYSVSISVGQLPC